MNDQEFKAVLALPAPARYEHFIKKVVDMEAIWSLGTDNGWALSGDDAGHEIVPVWPDERYAAACAIDEWAGNEPRSIPLNHWLNAWLPGIARDFRLIAVFPTPESKGPIVTPERLREDMQEELQKYE